ncbi:hypothetical protein [uncultured Jatrophihabitans sp.]|uniref:hypothetical protein n=1 Tax=uncultured Jatrophihabitans sp. TaxID=1610747 RepID=UPI0035CC6519
MSEYVTNESWVRTLVRTDAIDDIADQFERHAPQPSLPVGRATARPEVSARWPRSARGWRSFDRLHPRSATDRFADK